MRRATLTIAELRYAWIGDALAEQLGSNGNGNALNARPPAVSSYTSVQDLFYELTARRALDDLMLPANVVEACRSLVEEQHRADVPRSHNLEPRHRLLFIGPPGNGKTSLAEVIPISSRLRPYLDKERL